MKDEQQNRRDFLKSSIKTAAFGVFALTSLDIKRLIAATENFTSTQDKVINISDYPELSKTGGYAMVTNNIIVIRTSSSNFLALSTICTHKKCDVEFDGEGFECPCHGSTFSKSGKVKSGPATKNLRSFKTIYNKDENTLTIKT